ncbi:hypothetical protein ABZ858_17330 [Streptomyces sp. NPDC047017]|uniref:hypothetical protein n=1 Tax=Streptomyces sp. NPDC047017 TaxID=3155024 RepID=UPI003405AAD6
MTAKHVLAAEAAVVGGLALALLVKELPGIVREIRIWRMVGLRPGGVRQPR